MTLLFTGANGFVGTELGAELARRNIDARGVVRCTGNFSLNYDAWGISDIDGETDWTHTLKDVDVVVHLAARVHIEKEKTSDPLAEFLKVNCYGTKNLAEQAAQANVKRLVYVSSIGVNGRNTHGGDFFSSADAPHPHSDYAMSKWRAEQALWRVAEKTALEVVVVRPPLIYGPAAKGNFYKLLRAMVKGIPLPLASAENARSLVYVGNIVDALICCATSPAAAGQTYLVRDGEDISTAVLVEKIAALLGRRSRSFHCPTSLLYGVSKLLGRSDQIDQLFGSLRLCDNKIRSDLGWTPPYQIDQGLRASVDWWINNEYSTGA